MSDHCQATCPSCGPTLAQRRGTNHVLHLLITILCCGLWLPVWVLLSIKCGGWLCSSCGAPCTEKSGCGGGFLVAIIAVAAVAYIALRVMA